MNLDFFQQYDICAFTPEYLKGVGEVTKVVVSEGEDHMISMTMRAFRSNLCKFYSIDYGSLRKKYGQIIESVNCIPLPINGNKIFLQLKVRTPEFRSDCAMGYLDLGSIAEVKEHKDRNRTQIRLRCGRKLEALCSIGTVNKHIKNAKLVLEHYRNEKGCGPYPEVLEKMYSNMDKPATKADILILAREILTLKNSLKDYENGV